MAEWTMWLYGYDEPYNMKKLSTGLMQYDSEASVEVGLKGMIERHQEESGREYEHYFGISKETGVVAGVATWSRHLEIGPGIK